MNINLAIELMLALLSKSAEIGALIAKLNVEGRTEFTTEEWDIIVQADNAARQRLVEAIAKKLEPPPPRGVIPQP